jgi:AraC-like DNA-binding protein
MEGAATHGRGGSLTSDSIRFDHFRVIVRELSGEAEAGNGRSNFRYSNFGYRLFQEEGLPAVSLWGGLDCPLNPNRILLIMPPLERFVSARKPAARIIVAFEADPRFVERILRQNGLSSEGLRSTLPLPFLVSREVNELCRLLVRETQHGGLTGKLYFKSLATALLLAIFSQVDPPPANAENGVVGEQRIQRAVALMEAKFASKLTRDEVARAAHLSPFHFSRLFRRVMGVSPHEYLLRCRLHHAQQLLRIARENRSIAHVAAEAGFADQAHLTRHFRRAYGVTPAEFRRAHE